MLHDCTRLPSDWQVPHLKVEIRPLMGCGTEVEIGNLKKPGENEKTRMQAFSIVKLSIYGCKYTTINGHHSIFINHVCCCWLRGTSYGHSSVLSLRSSFVDSENILVIPAVFSLCGLLDQSDSSLSFSASKFISPVKVKDDSSLVQRLETDGDTNLSGSLPTAVPTYFSKL